MVLVIADDRGVELGCYGDKHARTPHLDAFAAEGVLFNTAWVTASSCSPSRGSIHTGLYSHQNGLIGLSHRGYSMHQEFPTFSSLLHEQGFRTAMIGKFHIAPENAAVWDYLFTEHHAHQQFSWFPMRTIRDDRYQLILNLTPEIGNPILGVDGCIVWDASRDPSLKGTMIRGVYDRLKNPPPAELFDLKNDPSLFHNLAEDPAYQDVRKKLESALLGIRQQTGDPFLDPDYLQAQNVKHQKLKEEHLKSANN